MAKIISRPKIKPITCSQCLCVYEFEIGDVVDIRYFDGQAVFQSTPCPVCGQYNCMEFIKEDEDVKD